MDFLTLSLPEALFLYVGIAVQALVRTSSLRHVPAIMVLAWTAVLLWRAATGQGRWAAVLGYFAASLLILILFWPDLVPFGRGTGQRLDATQVGSYTAREGGGQVVTAAQTEQVPSAFQAAVLVPPGTRLLLRIVTETPLALARTINSQTHRAFASLMPMLWLLGTDLTTDITTAVADWVHSCYLPVMTSTMAGAEGRTVQELLPWGDSPIRRELARREVAPGAQTGITWLRGPTTGNIVRCDVYLEAVEFRTQAWLFELRSPKGTPLLEVFQQELGMDARQQAQFLLYREMLRAAGPAVPAPSLTGTYAALRGMSVGGRAVGGAASSAVTSWLGGAWSAGLTLLGAGRSAGAGVGAEFQRVIDGLSWLVGLAVFFTWWAPYMIGLLNLVLLSLAPFIVLWSLIPGNQFQPWAYYVAALLFTNSAPLWWALADQAAKLAKVAAPQSDDLLLGLGNTAVAFGWSTVVIVLAVLIIPVATSLVFFGVLRNVASLLRGGV